MKAPRKAASEPAAPHIPAERVRLVLRQHFGTEGAVILEEVGESTGHRTGARWIDMLVMETWPSRGFVIHGIEIKVSRADWQKELATPAKAEALHKHCDRWWVATANKGVIRSTDELPPGWGWLEIKPIGDGFRTVVVQPARVTERPPELDRRFVAALLRAGSKARNREDDSWLEQRVQERVKSRLENALADRTSRRTGAATVAEKLLEAFGDDAAWLEADGVIRAARLVKLLNLHSSHGPITQALDALTVAGEKAMEIRAALEAEVAAAGLTPPERKSLLKKNRLV